MKLKKRNIIIASIILTCSMSVIGYAEVKEIIAEKNTVVEQPVSTITKSSEMTIDKTETNTVETPIAQTPNTNTIAPSTTTNQFTDKEFEQMVNNVYQGCKVGWSEQSYDIEDTGNGSIWFAKKYKDSQTLSEYEKQVYKDVVDLAENMYNYFKFIPKNLNADKTPAMKIKIETLLEHYNSVFIVK